MTNQELYTTCRNHLLKQGQKSIIDRADGRGPTCAYRGEGGLKCAIGILISDEKYKHEFEGNSANNSKVAEAAGLTFTPHLVAGCVTIVAEGEQVTLASALQNCHDAYEPERWKERLDRIAIDHNLKVEEPSKEPIVVLNLDLGTTEVVNPDTIPDIDNL